MSADRLTVLHVTEVTGGGVENAIRQYVGNVQDVNHVILAPSDGGLAGEESCDFVAFSRRSVARVSEIRRVVAQVRPSLVHAHSSWAGLHTRFTSLGVPVAYQPHAFAFSGYAGSAAMRRGYRAAEKTLSRRTASFVALSEHESILASSLNPRIPIAHVVNTSGLPSGAELKFGSGGSDCPRVAMAGRVAPQKDPEFYAEFAAHLRRLVADVKLIWIGEGEPALTRQLRNAGIEVTGWLSPSEVADRLALTSLYVHTARYEGFPLSVLDAAASGVPVLLRRTPSTTGIDLLQAESAASLAELGARVLNGGARAQAIKLTQQIHASHSAAAQRESLLRAYEITLDSREALSR